jgi:hypothetical protein
VDFVQSAALAAILRWLRGSHDAALVVWLRNHTIFVLVLVLVSSAYVCLNVQG